MIQCQTPQQNHRSRANIPRPVGTIELYTKEMLCDSGYQKYIRQPQKIYTHEKYLFVLTAQTKREALLCESLHVFCPGRVGVT